MSAALRFAPQPELAPGPRLSEDLDALLELYRKHGFDAGYHQALRDQLEGLVLQAEAFLGTRGPQEGDRKLLYAFIAQLERHLRGQSPLTAGGFADGAGI